MRSLWPAWATKQNPVFRYETGRWRRSRFLRFLQPAAWSVVVFLFLLFVCLPATCAGLVAVAPASVSSTSNTRLSDFLAAGVLFLLASSALSALASGMLGLVSSALAATLIAREREAQTWPLLRLTTLTPVQIVGGKLAAFLNILQNSMHLVALWRGLTVAAAVGGGLIFVLMAPELQGVVSELGKLAPLDSGLLLAGLAIVGLITVVYWLTEPYFTVIYNGAVGLAVSTFARTRRWAIALVFIAQFTLGLALYWPIQQIAALVPMAFVVFLYQINPKAPVDPTLWTLPTVGLQYVVLFGLQAGVLAGSLATAIYRAGRLSD
jgi:hypothetical protein